MYQGENHTQHEGGNLDEAEMNMDFDEQDLDVKREKIQQKNSIDWLKSRYRKTTNLKYLYYPEELIKKGELKRIFLNFDADESKGIDLQEFLYMFIDNYIDDIYSTHQSTQLKKIAKENNHKIPTTEQINFSITGSYTAKTRPNLTKKQKKVMEEILFRHFKKLFTTVTNKNELSLVDFVSLGINKESVDLFTNFMRHIKQDKEFKNSTDFLPMSFDDMVEFLSYRSKREDICLQFEKENDWITKYRHCQKLFDLQENLCNERAKVISRALQKNNRVKEDDIELLTEDQMIDKLKVLNSQKIQRADTVELDAVKGDEILEKYQNERKFTYNDEQIRSAQSKFNLSNAFDKENNQEQKTNFVGNLMGGTMKKKGEEVIKKNQTSQSVASLLTKKQSVGKQPSQKNTLVASILIKKEDLSDLKLDIKKKPPSLINLISKPINSVNDIPTEVSDNVTYFRLRKDKYNLLGDKAYVKKYQKKMEDIKKRLDNKIEVAKSTAKTEVETFFNEVDSLDPYHDHSRYITRKKSHIIKNHNFTLSSSKSQSGFYGKQVGMYATTKTGFKMYDSQKNFASSTRVGFGDKAQKDEERKQNIFDQIKTRINKTQNNKDNVDPFNPAFAKTSSRYRG